ncbi:MAG: putative flap endonuclease-1-like 5' DNA nuclease [Candidatus Promineifilaceae bacterium]|jgi:predicted flap endonuclease-1-like 5' DNA nuclease
MLPRIFYIALGFAVGYFLDSLKNPKNKHEVEQKAPTSAQTSVEHPITSRTLSTEASVKEVEQVSPDFLQVINGIGPVYAKRLFENGIRSMTALAHADRSKIAEAAQVRIWSNIDEWIAKAQELSSSS